MRDMLSECADIFQAVCKYSDSVCKYLHIFLNQECTMVGDLSCRSFKLFFFQLEFFFSYF